MDFKDLIVGRWYKVNGEMCVFVHWIMLTKEDLSYKIGHGLYQACAFFKDPLGKLIIVDSIDNPDIKV